MGNTYGYIRTSRQRIAGEAGSDPEAQALQLRGAGVALEVWPESHWPGFALRQADVIQSYTAW